MTQAKTFYFGAGWFNEKQNKAYKEAMEALKANPTADLEHSFVPLEHPYKNIDVVEHPEYLKDKEWGTATYQGDLVGIKSNDITLGVYLPEEEDVGLGVELGYAHGLGKFIILAIPDEDYGKAINLMSWGVADAAIKISELKDYDFNQCLFNFYDGAVY